MAQTLFLTVLNEQQPCNKKSGRLNKPSEKLTTFVMIKFINASCSTETVYSCKSIKKGRKKGIHKIIRL